MKIIEEVKNGVVVNAVKSYEELTDAEKEALVIPYSTAVSDYANFQVRYNKKGELLGVEVHDFSSDKNVENEQPKVDVIDAMKLVNGNKRQVASAQKAYQAATGHRISSQNIKAARNVLGVRK